MIQREQRGVVAILRMARGKGNSLSTEFLEALIAALDAEETSPATAVVLTGEGRTFSAGVDLPTAIDGFSLVESDPSTHRSSYDAGLDLNNHPHFPPCLTLKPSRSMSTPAVSPDSRLIVPTRETRCRSK